MRPLLVGARCTAIGESRDGHFEADFLDEQGRVAGPQVQLPTHGGALPTEGYVEAVGVWDGRSLAVTEWVPTVRPPEAPVSVFPMVDQGRHLRSEPVRRLMEHGDLVDLRVERRGDADWTVALAWNVETCRLVLEEEHERLEIVQSLHSGQEVEARAHEVAQAAGESAWGGQFVELPSRQLAFRQLVIGVDARLANLRREAKGVPVEVFTALTPSEDEAS